MSRSKGKKKTPKPVLPEVGDIWLWQANDPDRCEILVVKEAVLNNSPRSPFVHVQGNMTDVETWMTVRSLNTYARPALPGEVSL